MASSSEASRQAMNLLGLPAAALKHVVQKLDTEDKKSLTLTCKAMPPIIHPLWRSIVVDLSAKGAPPATLREFQGVTNIVIADSALAPINNTLDWDDFAEGGYEIQDTLTQSYKERALSVISFVSDAYAFYQGTQYDPPLVLRPSYGGGALSRISRAVSAIWGTNKAALGTQSPRELTLQIAIRPLQQISKLVPLLVHATPEEKRAVPRTRMGQVTEALAKMFTTVLKGAEVPTANADHGGSACSIGSVEVGWVLADGELTDVITKGTVCWFPSIAPEYFKLELYKEIHSLRLCVLKGDAETVTDAFPLAVATKLNALPLLRELHLGCSRPGWGEFRTFELHLDGRDLQLPALTKLAINERVLLTSFGSLTHLSSLQALSIAFPDLKAISEDYHPEDLGALAELKMLSSLLIDNWCIDEEQDISVLNQPSLTKLRFYKVEGRVSLVNPMAPMPNLKEFHFERSFYGKRWRFLMNDCRVASWALGTAGAANFPNVGLLNLKLMGLEEGTNARRDEGVTTDLIHEMLAHSPSLKSLYVGKVLINVSSLVVNDAHFMAPRIEDEIEVVGDGGLQNTWKRSLRWGVDPDSYSRMIKYGFGFPQEWV